MKRQRTSVFVFVAIASLVGSRAAHTANARDEALPPLEIILSWASIKTEGEAAGHVAGVIQLDGCGVRSLGTCACKQIVVVFADPRIRSLHYRNCNLK